MTVTLADLKAAPAPPKEATLQTPLSTAYRLMVNKSRACFTHAMFRVDADYFHDEQKAAITVALNNGSNVITLSHTQLTAPTPATTKVSTVYFRLSETSEDWRWLATSFEEWGNDKPGYCKK